MEENEITKVEQFGLKNPDSLNDIENGVDEILSQYSSRDMANVQISAYLGENKVYGLEFVKKHKLNNSQELKDYLSNRHAKARKSVIENRKKEAKDWKEEVGRIHLDAITDMALKQGKEMDDKIANMDNSYKHGGSVKRNLTYLGEVGGDKIGQKSSLEKAKLLEKQGVSNEQIRQETGWFLNPYDEKWRFEISDEDFDVILNFSEIKKMFDNDKNLTFVKKNLDEVVKHDKLFEAYPEFRAVPFYFLNESDRDIATLSIPKNKKHKIYLTYNLHDEENRLNEARGVQSFRQISNQEGLLFIFNIANAISRAIGESPIRFDNDVYKFRRNIFIHELQHLIQSRETFGAGSSEEWWFKKLLKENGLDEGTINDVQRDYFKLEANKYYHNASGELESKDVDKRIDFNDNERKLIKPLSEININEKYLNIDLEEPFFLNGGSIKRNLNIDMEHNFFNNGGGINYPKVQYKGDDTAFYYVVGEYDDDNYILVFEEKLEHWKNTKDKAERREYFEEIDVKSEFEPYINKLKDGGELKSSDIEKKIENRIKERQKGKQFQDTSVVGYTRKYSAAYDIITSADLSKIEVDNVTAYKLIEKSKIWIPYNTETLKEQGNSSGCAYLKVKTREAVSARPIDTKIGREVYVKNIEKLIVLLEPCKIVSEVQDVLKDFVNLDSFDFIDLSNLKDANYIQNSNVGNLKNHYQRDVLNYFEDIFGKRFYAFCRFTSESARKIAVEANLYQAFPKVYRDIIVNNRISDLSSKLAKFEKMLAMVSDDADENRKNTREFDENYSGVAYGKDYVTDYYKMRIDSYKTNLENVDSKLSKIYDVRENDWSWSGEKTKKEKVEVDALDKVAKEPLTIMEQYGIEDWRKSAKRQPLAYIKRTGGLNVNDISTKEIQNQFGFRNVVFGNYVNDKESKEHSRHFIGAMLDLHETMNLNVKQINEIGGLDINFGSTGCGSFSLAMACYFPENKAINLTKKTGDGSVAHEWSHYLDNMLGEGNDRGATGRKYATLGDGVYKGSDKIKFLFAEWNNWLKKGGEYKEVEIEYHAQKKFKFKVFGEDLQTAIEGVKKRYQKTYDTYELSSSPDAIKYYGYLAHKFNNNNPITVKFNTNATTYLVNSGKYGGTDYWTNPKELFARSFEWAIEEMLKRKGRVSNYLVDIQNSMGLMALMIPYNLHPYPRVKEEQEWLLDWYDRLFSAIRTEYAVTPFRWDTVERTDEYLEYENKKTDVIAEGVIVSEQSGEAEIIGEDIEYRENGYSFKRNNVNGTSLYTVLINDKASDFYIGTSENYGVKSDSGYSKKGWVILTKLPNEEKYSTISYFKTLKEAQDVLVNDVKIEPVKVMDLPKPKNEYVKREEIKFTPISLEAKQFIPTNQYSVIKTNPEFEDARIRINELVANCPKTYETEEIETNKKLAQLHYFRGGSDWYIIEKDSENEQLQAFGYVILNGDTENAEFGYINIEEVKKYAEIDLYWTPITLGKIRGEVEEFTKEEYLSALEGAEATLEFLEGKDKQDLVDYIEGLKIIINLD